MMYRMKKIIVHDKDIDFPNCMYTVKYRTDFRMDDDSDINISNQVIKFLKSCLVGLVVPSATATLEVLGSTPGSSKVLLGFSVKFPVAARSLDLCPVDGNRLAPYYMGPKPTGELWVYISTPLPNPSGKTGVMGSSKMSELEQRQDQLLQKLDILYDRIKTISSYCNVNNNQDVRKSVPEESLPTPEEVVLVLNPDSLPWYLNILLKKSTLTLNISWHIHSSVPNEKVPKIKNFIKILQESVNNPRINLRLIFKCVSADTELKLSTLDVPIVGNVNILRYLSYVYPSVIPYNPNDHHVDYFLDLCHVLERTSDKNKEAVVNKLCSQQTNWIYGNEFSIVDVAAYNVIKQWKNIPKYIPKAWFDKCDKLFS